MPHTKVLRALREGTQYQINENPSTIVVRRVTYAPDGAGGRRANAPVTLPPFVGRLVPSMASGRERYFVNDPGMEQWAGYALMCPHTANIEGSSSVTDTITLQGTTYEVLRVVVRGYKGQAYRKVAILQEVS
jgi:hypothetical protein